MICGIMVYADYRVNQEIGYSVTTVLCDDSAVDDSAVDNDPRSGHGSGSEMTDGKAGRSG